MKPGPRVEITGRRLRRLGPNELRIEVDQFAVQTWTRPELMAQKAQLEANLAEINEALAVLDAEETQ